MPIKNEINSYGDEKIRAPIEKSNMLIGLLTIELRKCFEYLFSLDI